MEEDKIAIATWLRNNPDEKGSETWDRAERALRLLVAQGTTPEASQDPSFLSDWMAENPDQEGSPRWNNAEKLLAGERPETPEMPEYEPSTYDRTVDAVYGSMPLRAAQGVARTPLGLLQFGLKGVDKGAEAMGYDPDLSGQLSESLNAAETMKRGGMRPGAPDIIGFGGEMAGPGGVASKIPLAKTLLGRLGQGIAGGVATGLSVPVLDEENYGRTKALQAGLGGLFGFGAPVVGAVARGVKNVATDFLPGGAQRAAVRLANESTGPRHADVVDNLRNSPTFSDDSATAAADARAAEFNALLNKSSRSGTRTSDVIQAEEVAAGRRQAAMHEIGGSSEDLAADIRARRIEANPLYNKAKQATDPINTSRTVGLIDRIIADSPQRGEINGPLRQVRRTLFKEAPPQGRRVSISRDPTNTGPQPQDDPRELISALENIKDMMERKGDNGTAAYSQAMRQLGLVRRQLENDIANVVPQQQAARQAYRRMSVPVNRRQVGQLMEEKFIPAMAEHGGILPQRGAVMANILREGEDVVRQATGQTNRNIDSVMGPQNMKVYDSVADDMARVAAAKKLASEGTAGARELIGKIGEASLPNFLNRTMMVLNAVLTRGGTFRRKAALDALGDLRLNRQELADLMEAATPDEIEMLQLFGLKTALPVASAEAASPEPAPAVPRRRPTPTSTQPPQAGVASLPSTGARYQQLFGPNDDIGQLFNRPDQSAGVGSLRGR